MATTTTERFESYIGSYGLTPAALRDLTKLMAGEQVSMTYGPWSQLVKAGLVSGEQDAVVLTEKAKVCRMQRR